MGFLTWIENTAIAEYVRVSAYGYPAMITLHSLGLAIMVGLSVVLSLRAVGMFGVIPYTSLHKLLKVAWIGFIINFLSGSALFSTSAIAFMQNTMFLIKITMVIVGAILTAIMQSTIKAGLVSGNPDSVAGKLKVLGWATIAAWTIGMVTGRLIAYL